MTAIASLTTSTSYIDKHDEDLPEIRNWKWLNTMNNHEANPPRSLEIKEKADNQ
jgi:hypothetical protein